MVVHALWNTAAGVYKYKLCVEFAKKMESHLAAPSFCHRSLAFVLSTRPRPQAA